MDSQTGFCPDRGTTDGLFTTFIGLRKRKEHGLETWALYIDLVKAFDVEKCIFALHISCYRSFDRSVEFLFEDNLLFEDS